MAQEWAPRAQVAVDAGPDQLRDFLRDSPPSRSDQVFRDLLQYIYKTHNQDPNYAGSLYEVVFEVVRPLPGSDRYHLQSQNNAVSAETRRRHPWADSDLSIYGVFRFSITDNDWQSVYQHQNIPVPPHSPLTQLIWDNAKEELYSQGAISVCAEFGLDDLLSKVLEKLKQKHTGPAGLQEQLDILFQIPPNGLHTALGVAIANRRTKCFDTLHLSVQGADEHVFRSRNVVTNTDKEVRLVPWTLERILERRGMGGNIGVLEEWEELLRRIINVEPRLLAQHDAEGMTPYAFALKVQASIQSADSEPAYNGLGSIIRNAIFERLKDPRIGDGRCIASKEVSLDLSDFNYGPQYFEHFVNDLMNFRSQLEARGKNWEFENTLLYLILPNLPTGCEDQVLANFLNWLKVMKVSRIVKLRLPDSSGRYTHQFVDRNILSLFEIDEFDWVRLDVSLDGFGSQPFWATFLESFRTSQVDSSTGPSADASTVKKTVSVRTMHVYSHGQFANNSIAFKAPRRFRCLENIQTIHLNLVRELTDQKTSFDFDERQDRATRYCDKIYEELQGGEVTFSKVARLLTWEEFALEPKFAMAEETFEFKLIKDLAYCREFLSAFPNMRKTPTPPNCWTRHCQKVFKEQRVKIAIIDNGADQMRSTISANIIRGMSFVRSSFEAKSILPWYTPAHPHGTQMADLIHSANPWCELFPLRVASLHKDVDLQAAIEAIDWAIEQNVDIVSISWIIKTEISQAREFARAIERATAKKVLVICATADVGAHSSADTWPANFENVIAISASNAYGLPMPWSHRDVHAMLDGDRIRACGPNYMRLDKDASASGSSVATALASGLASLCLFLARMANEDGMGEKFKDRLVMLALIWSMQANELDRVIELSGFFDSTFKPATDYQRGHLEPPKGLQRFLWKNFEDLYSDDRRRQASIGVRRRSVSARRGTS